MLVVDSFTKSHPIKHFHFLDVSHYEFKEDVK